eukprot:1161558-Pelagomonas_calceolata.AAC.6
MAAHNTGFRHTLGTQLRTAGSSCKRAMIPKCFKNGRKTKDYAARAAAPELQARADSLEKQAKEAAEALTKAELQATVAKAEQRAEAAEKRAAAAEEAERRASAAAASAPRAACVSARVCVHKCVPSSAAVRKQKHSLPEINVCNPYMSPPQPPNTFLDLLQNKTM